MDIASLMSGIAVVIDDAYMYKSEGIEDDIEKVVKNIEDEWEIPFFKTAEIPEGSLFKNLIQAASFVLLDWNLWFYKEQKLNQDVTYAPELRRKGIEDNVAFLRKLKEHF